MQMKPDTFLADLAGKLRAIKRRNLATQLEIERETGIDQATISRAMNNRPKRVTEHLRVLMNYADMLLKNEPLPLHVEHAAREFFAAGGSEAELIASIRHSAKLVARKLG